MLWQSQSRYFLTLPYRQQRALHDYYQPAQDLTDEQLLEHRLAITAEQPNLSAAAGKAFRVLERTYREATKSSDGDPKLVRAEIGRKVRYTRSAPSIKGRRVTVSALVRPDLNLDELARVLIEVAKEMPVKDQKADSEATDQDEAA